MPYKSCFSICITVELRGAPCMLRY